VFLLILYIYKSFFFRLRSDHFRVGGTTCKSRGGSMMREEEVEEEMGQDTVEKQLIMSPIK